MPVYTFVCDECGERFEKKVSVQHGEMTMVCPNGHVKTHRVFTPPTIVFKGSGFYSTDHRPKKAASAD